MLMTVREFCAEHRLSKSRFYELVAEGKGPAITKLGPRMTRISAEAAAAWRRKFEGKAGQPIPPRVN